MKNYAFLKEVWQKENMETFEDFLRYYNNLDVIPFVEAVEKMQYFYKDLGIDFLKEALSIPGVARKYLFQTNPVFALFGEEDADLYRTIKKNIVGGPSIIFTRYHEVGKTLIRGQKLCQNIVGYNCNSLYLWAIGEKMPSDSYVRHDAPDFKPKVNAKYLHMLAWMDDEAQRRGIKIYHKLNAGKEHRIGPYFCDGFDPVSKTVFEFNGCWYHGHKCRLTRRAWKHHGKLMEKRQRQTEEKKEYLQRHGYRLVEMTECSYNILPVTKYLPSYYQSHKKGLTPQQILNDVQSEQLFGMVEVNIEVPDHLYSSFEEMSPLFCTCDVPVKSVGKLMEDHIQKHNLSSRPRRLLVGGMKAERLLLLTPLLKWYLDHGLHVSEIFQVIEFTPSDCFKDFQENVSEARRKGDLSPDFLLLGDTMKLLGNSAYGSMIMDQEKHQKIEYAKGKDIDLKVNLPTFKKLEDLGDDFAEIELVKGRQKLNLPIQIGYAILQYAKLKMLEWYYDFLLSYVDKNDFEYIEMDTDSAYFAIAGPTLRDVIKPEKRQDFDDKLFHSCHLDQVQPNPFWFPRECCGKHKAFDRRQSGLFKLEKEGVVMVALCSKTYVLKDREGVEKTALKGINKDWVENALEKSKSVLETGKTASVNKSFRLHNNTIFTYEQEKTGFSAFYCKRELVDALRTKPLDLVLNPWGVKEAFSIEKFHILSPCYPCQVMVDSKEYDSIFQYLLEVDHLSVSEKETLGLLCIKERFAHDYYFQQSLLALSHFDFVWVSEHYFWGCGQTSDQYRMGDEFPGANMWGYCLNKFSPP